MHSRRPDRYPLDWYDGGLAKFDRKNDQFTHYTTANGLPSDTLYGILEDEQGRLWLSTTNGLSRFDPRTESFRNYDVGDGLQSNTFLNTSSYSKSQSGEMFFGGSNGFNAFYPDQIVDNPAPPPVLIADFQLANEPVPIGADSVLQKSILETDKLMLSYLDRVFTFEIAVLNYRAPAQNRYRYRMEGFEQEWHEVDRMRRYVTYTNLDPGEYVFRAIGSNNDGIWNEEGASIRISVIPPWWETMWFQISMVVAAIGLIAGGFRWRISAVEAKSRELEAQVKRMTQIKRIRAERDRILEVSQDMICIVGMDGSFKYLNPAWEMNLGYAVEELLSRKFLDFVHPDDRAKTMRESESLVSGRQTVDFENRYTHKDGSIRHLSWMATPLPDKERVYAVARDITERKRAERDLKQYQQRLKALATQLTITEEKERRAIATDLHDQVGYSLSLANMQLNEILEVDSVFERTLLVKDISNILLKALQDTRSLIFELSSPSLNEIGLAAAISEWLEEQITKRYDLKIEFIDATDDNYGKMLDSNVLALLFRNVRELLTNVIKHSRAQNVRVQIISEGNCLKITVEDDGVGFNPDADNTKRKETEGFGLFSIQERMADLGGSFDIQSHPGKGCRMTLISPPIVGKE